MKRLPVLDPNVAAVLDCWCPEGWSERDLRALESVRETVREWVVKAAPGNPHVARRLLRSTAMLAVVGLSHVGHHRPKRGVGSPERRALGDVGQRGPVVGLAGKHSGSLTSSREGSQPESVAPAKTGNDPGDRRPALWQR